MTFKNKFSAFERTIKCKFGRSSIYIHCKTQLTWDKVLERLKENNIGFWNTYGSHYYNNCKRNSVVCLERKRNTYVLLYGNKKRLNIYSDNPLLVSSKQFLDATENKIHRIRIISKHTNIK